MKITVRLGDSLWYYSQLFNIPVILIETSNPGINALQIQVGQEIKIPGYLRENYTIEPNDSFWRLAIENNIPLDLIELMNSTIDSSQLQVGQTIYLPRRVTEFVIDDIANYTYERMVTDINELLSIYPFIMKRSIGSSVMGKDITELQIGAGPTEVHLNGSFHANEWITTPII
ncbi:MAG: LysM peptidoglycan-binding domain-containing protein, partial [Oceanobacillus sp.]|nr:LysM peptidoglycan-binding domain-containing protein [Oceanobacillus sp.]